MECFHPKIIPNPADKKLSIIVPCKNCIACKINKTSEWTMRLLMQRHTTPDCRFLTLTYNNENIPLHGTLVKDDVSDFFKSFRQEIGDDRRIKMFTCGEYGDSYINPVTGRPNERPHYHSVVFGVNPDDRFSVAKCWSKSDTWKFTGSTWQKSFGSVTSNSCQYVAGYCQKKLFGDYAKSEYEDKGRIPPFQLQSKKIGEEFFIAHMKQYVEDGFIFFCGKRHPIPETWKRKFDLNFDKYLQDVYAQKLNDFLQKNPNFSFGLLYDFWMNTGIRLWAYEEYNSKLYERLTKELNFETNPLKRTNSNVVRQLNFVKKINPIASTFQVNSVNQLVSEIYNG